MGVATGTFVYPNGSPVANGIYQWKLSSDAIEQSVACIAPSLFSGQLDTNGNMSVTFLFNDVLSTSCGASTNYQLTVKGQGGGQVWNEMYFLTGTAANLNSLLPSCGPGSQIQTTTASTAARIASINYVIDGGGVTVLTGSKGQVNIPTGCTITGWVITADQSGSAVVGVNAGGYSSFPTLINIAGADPPTLTSAQKNENLAVSLWTPSVAAGAQVQFSVTSATTVTRLNVALNVTIP